MKITGQSPLVTAEPQLQVRIVRKVAPCGGCKKEVPRDLMWAMNVLFVESSGSDADQERVRIRLCVDCYEKERARAISMEWDNSKMRIE